MARKGDRFYLKDIPATKGRYKEYGFNINQKMSLGGFIIPLAEQIRPQGMRVYHDKYKWTEVTPTNPDESVQYFLDIELILF